LDDLGETLMTYETSNDPKMRCTKVLLAEGQDPMIDLAYEKVQLQFVYEPILYIAIYI
jgi:pyruvate/2-oxoglutarate dehydrogenase complex dihydrolipoamide dehydrogenase (E3) component